MLAPLSAGFQSLPPLPTIKVGLCSAASQWVDLCMFWDPVGLSNELSCEAGNFSHCLNTHRYFQSEALRFYFPVLEPWVAWSVSLPNCSPWFIHTQMWDCPVLKSTPCCMSSLPQLPVSAPPTSRDVCFFFNSCVVRLPYGSIF